MVTNEDKIKKAGDLRRVAEEKVRQNSVASSEAHSAGSPEDVQRMLHECYVINF
jgi:hypothetical protein